MENGTDENKFIGYLNIYAKPIVLNLVYVIDLILNVLNIKPND